MRPRVAVALLAFAVVPVLAACTDDPADGDLASGPTTTSATIRPALRDDDDHVLLLGDSLTVGADLYGDVDRQLRIAGFDDVEIIAEEGRDTTWGIEQVEDLDAVPELVVVELGTNPSADPAGFDELVATLIDDLRARGAQRIAWLTPAHGLDDRYTDKVDVLLAATGIDAVADWATVMRDDPARLAADGLHPTQEGYADLADFLVDTAGDLAR